MWLTPSAKKYQLRRQDLLGRNRKRYIAEARVVAALLVRESSHLSLTELSREFGHDLSSLSQAAARIEKRMEREPSLADTVAAQLKRDLIKIPICQA
jgi:chromosomal replication initiation ATPase DnaA